MEPYLWKKYTLVAIEDLNAVLEDLGFTSRLIDAPPEILERIVMEFKYNKADDTYVLSSTSPRAKLFFSFQPGVEHVRQTPEGFVIKTVVTITDNKLRKLITYSNGKWVNIIYIFSEEGVEVLLQSNGATARKLYKLKKD